MDQIYVFVVGTAGSGKTYFTKAFSEWLDFKKIDNITINLDPGAENVPYSADIDVREWFTLEDIMVKYNVGPNGAQIIGADLIATKIDEIKDEIEYYNSPYVIIDTPGQMELFTLRSSGELFVRVFGEKNCVMVYLYDPIISKTPSGFLSLIFMASSAVLRLNIPHIAVLSKSDILPNHELEKILNWSINPDFIYSELLEMENKELSKLSNTRIGEKGIANDLFHMLKDLKFFKPLIPVSSTTGFGMDDVYDEIQEIYYGGDDLEKLIY